MTIPIVERAEAFTTRRAIVAAEGTFTYGDLLATSERVASELLDGVDDLLGARVVFLVPGGFQYVAVQWGIWRAGGVAVPLALSETEREIRYKVDDTEPAVLIAHPDYADTLRPFAEDGGPRFITTTELLSGDRTALLPDVDPERAAMILYTSGTTSDPKGVVATHNNVIGAGREPRRGVGLVVRRLHPEPPAPPPRTRHHQRYVVRPVGRCHVRASSSLRRRANLVAHDRPRSHPVHGRSDGVQGAHRGVGFRSPRMACGGIGCVLEPAADGVRIRRPARPTRSSDGRRYRDTGCLNATA